MARPSARRFAIAMTGMLLCDVCLRDTICVCDPNTTNGNRYHERRLSELVWKRLTMRLMGLPARCAGRRTKPTLTSLGPARSKGSPGADGRVPLGQRRVLSQHVSFAGGRVRHGGGLPTHGWLPRLLLHPQVLLIHAATIRLNGGAHHGNLGPPRRSRFGGHRYHGCRRRAAYVASGHKQALALALLLHCAATVHALFVCVVSGMCLAPIRLKCAWRGRAGDVNALGEGSGLRIPFGEGRLGRKCAWRGFLGTRLALARVLGLGFGLPRVGHPRQTRSRLAHPRQARFQPSQPSPSAIPTRAPSPKAFSTHFCPHQARSLPPKPSQSGIPDPYPSQAHLWPIPASPSSISSIP